MSPDKKKKLNQLRKNLDKLDNKLINLIKIRKNLVNEVIKQKNFKKEIIDKKRIAVILKSISKKSKKKNIDPRITHKIWSAMIKAFIDYEFRNFDKK